VQPEAASPTPENASREPENTVANQGNGFQFFQLLSLPFHPVIEARLAQVRYQRFELRIFVFRRQAEFFDCLAINFDPIATRQKNGPDNSVLKTKLPHCCLNACRSRPTSLINRLGAPSPTKGASIDVIAVKLTSKPRSLTGSTRANRAMDKAWTIS
jgi:hypothetical protein